ncbi:MAG: carbamoyltransferase HypF, partial [Campylobacterota bacterium]|nr:carbamoyltransferase HypF [Campylobacterota bacterium]
MYRLEIKGVVQGVGFRPFIYNLALLHVVNGFVTNDGSGVLVVLDCDEDKLDRFLRDVKLKAPSLSRIDSVEVQTLKVDSNYDNFTIKKSKISSHISLEIPSDIAMCDDCKQELEDEDNRRYNYPFITCTACGPRFSIIKNLPYDRCNTSMDKFEMCSTCRDEYTNPKDRRYHAQPIGCFDCGAKLSLFDSDGKPLHIDNMIERVAEFIKNKKIVAIKGIGGYHLVCDSTCKETIKRLREKKQRPSKPFAVMAKDIDSAKKIATISITEEKLLNSNKRPIVLLPKKDKTFLSDLVAPNIEQVGVFLAYTPLHHILLNKLDMPIVATSANLSSEPLATSKEEIMKLSHIWDYCLDNDREIVNSCDDSVMFVENEMSFMLRNARGYTPLYLPFEKKTDKKILSLGANQKSTVAIVVDDKVILSPYIGDLDSLSSLKHYHLHVEMLKRVYQF